MEYVFGFYPAPEELTSNPSTSSIGQLDASGVEG
jgi:hypothetical protein